MATKPAPRPLTDRTEPVMQTLMGKPAAAKPMTKQKQISTLMGGNRGK